MKKKRNNETAEFFRLVLWWKFTKDSTRSKLSWKRKEDIVQKICQSISSAPARFVWWNTSERRQHNEPEHNTLFQNSSTHVKETLKPRTQHRKGVKSVGEKIISNCSMLNPPMTYKERKERKTTTQIWATIFIPYKPGLLVPQSLLHYSRGEKCGRKYCAIVYTIL